MEQSVVAVKSEQKGTDHARASRVTKATYDAISGSHSFHLYGCSAFSRRVGSVEAFSKDAVKIAPGFPGNQLFATRVISRSRRESYVLC